jgi:hypothetical protein
MCKRIPSRRITGLALVEGRIAAGFSPILLKEIRHGAAYL